MTAWAEAARSSPKKLQSRSQTTLAEPKKGSVWMASRSFANGVQGVAAVGNGGINDFLVHAAGFSRPGLENFFGALFYGEFIIAANERERKRRILQRAFYSADSPAPLSLMRLSTSLMSSTCSKSSDETKIGFFWAEAMARQSLGRASTSTIFLAVCNSFCCCKMSRAK